MEQTVSKSAQLVKHSTMAVAMLTAADVRPINIAREEARIVSRKP